MWIFHSNHRPEIIFNVRSGRAPVVLKLRAEYDTSFWFRPVEIAVGNRSEFEPRAVFRRKGRLDQTVALLCHGELCIEPLGLRSRVLSRVLGRSPGLREGGVVSVGAPLSFIPSGGGKPDRTPQTDQSKNIDPQLLCSEGGGVFGRDCGPDRSGQFLAIGIAGACAPLLGCLVGYLALRPRRLNRRPSETNESDADDKAERDGR